MKPTIGRIVHYQLSAADAEAINRRRDHFSARVHLAKEERLGCQAHRGNGVVVGEVYPAMVVRVFDPSTGTANLQVVLDGNDSYWATSCCEGTEPGTWSWPKREE